MKTSLELILFDLDNTLLHSSEAYEQALLAVAPQGPAEFLLARKEVKARMEKGSPSSHHRLLYFKKMLENEKRFSATELLKFFDQYNEALVTCLRERWIELHREEWLRSLSQKYQLGIITNETLRNQLLKLEIIDPRGDIFGLLLTSEEVGVEKPHPRIFTEALNHFKKSPQQACFIGDSVKDDILPTLALGFQKVFHSTEFSQVAISEYPKEVVIVQKLTDIEKHL
jgi:putative hydrolase of the HAD superfamily